MKRKNINALMAAIGGCCTVAVFGAIVVVLSHYFPMVMAIVALWMLYLLGHWIYVREKEGDDDNE
jgi:hypothetical protein